MLLLLPARLVSRRGFADFQLKENMRDLQILGPRRVTWSKFHTEGPQILDAAVQNVVARATGRPGLLQPW
jgi:hypothetical protein